MSARDGKPCRKCGKNEWYANGQCVPCKRERNLRWKKANPEKNAEYTRRSVNAHPERRAENKRKWRQANPEKETATGRNWRKANPEKNAARVARYRTSKTNAGGSYTAAEWKDLCDHYGNRCLGCGRNGIKLEADHVIPVTKGGSSNIDNIQPLCRSCNASKSNKEIDYRPGTGLGRWIQRKIFG